MQQGNPVKKVINGDNIALAESASTGRGLLFAAAVAGLCLLTILAYSGVVHNEFVSFDDPDYVTDNYHVKQGVTAEGLKWAFTNSYASNWHPLTWMSHMLDVQVFGLKSAAGHHLVSLGFHIANTLLLLGFLIYVTGRRWCSLLVAALFALHPVHVESVAWVSERKDVLSTFFWMLTMISYVWYTRRPSVGRYIVPVVLMALGLMAKPMLVTMPVVLLILDFWPLGRMSAVPDASKVTIHRLFLEKIPFAALSAASALMTISAQDRSINPMSIMGPAIMWTNAVVSYGRYLGMMLWPSNLCVYYPHPFVAQRAAAAGVGILLAVVTAVAWRYRRQYPYLLAGWLWYVITLVPVIGLVQVGGQSHADRYTYIPLIGPFIMLVWGLSRLIEGKSSSLTSWGWYAFSLVPLIALLKVLGLLGASFEAPTAFIGLLIIGGWILVGLVIRWLSPKSILPMTMVILLLCLAAMTCRAVGYWKNSITLFSRAVSVVGDDGKLLGTLGARYIEAGRTEEGIDMLERAVRSKGYDGSAHNALAVVYLHRGDKAKAIEYFKEATKYDWTNIKAERNLGAIYSNMRNYKEAAIHLRKAVELDPYTGETYALLAAALAETGDISGAQAACEKALKLSPQMAVTYYAQGTIYARQGKYPEAVNAFVKSMDISPGYMTFGSLGNALYMMGRLPDAAQSYKRAIELEPGKSEAWYNLAFVLEKMGDKDGAMAAVKKLLEIDPKDAEGQAMYKRLGGE
jgi:protein O-mannosyl-transferase